jgi:hypothetical protein
MEKHYYIKHIERTTEPLSKLSIEETTLLDDKLDTSKYESIFMNSAYSGGKVSWKEIILKTKQGFYLFIRRHSLHKNIIDVDIYYRQEQHNELLVFIKPFINTLTK